MEERKSPPRKVKIFNWIIALLGLWEAGDIAALFVPNFGHIQAAVWNHILVGIFLMLLGAWGALTGNRNTARTLDWIAAAAGAWLVLASFLLRRPIIPAALLNDVLVGVIVLILGIWAATAAPSPAPADR